MPVHIAALETYRWRAIPHPLFVPTPVGCQLDLFVITKVDAHSRAGSAPLRMASVDRRAGGPAAGNLFYERCRTRAYVSRVPPSRVRDLRAAVRSPERHVDECAEGVLEPNTIVSGKRRIYLGGENSNDGRV